MTISLSRQLDRLFKWNRWFLAFGLAGMLVIFCMYFLVTLPVSPIAWLLLVSAMVVVGAAYLATLMRLLGIFWQLLPGRRESVARALIQLWLPIANLVWMFSFFGTIGQEFDRATPSEQPKAGRLPQVFCLVALAAAVLGASARFSREFSVLWIAIAVGVMELLILAWLLERFRGAAQWLLAQKPEPDRVVGADDGNAAFPSGRRRWGRIVWLVLIGAVVAGGMFLSIRGLWYRQKLQSERAAQAAATPSVKYAIGGVDIAFPVPDGYVDIRSEPEMAEAIVYMEARHSQSGKRLVTEIARRENLEREGYYRFGYNAITISATAALENAPPISAAQWQESKSAVATEWKNLTVHCAEQGISVEAAMRADADAAYPMIPAGVAFEEKDVCALYLFTKSRTESVPPVALQLQLLGRIKGRLLVIALTEEYRSEADRESLRRAGLDYWRLLRLLN